MWCSMALTALLTCSPSATEGLTWVADYAKAKEMAAAEGKDLVINFTGSDWCGWCIRLDEEVFSQPEFVEEASEDFIFVFLDFPNSEEKKAAVVDPELNQKLQEAHGVKGFPTIILADAQGRPYGRTGYEEGGPENYLSSLSTLRENGEAVKALSSAKEPTKELMVAAFSTLADQDLLGYPEYKPYLAMARKMDADGKLGMLPKILAVEQNMAFDALLMEKASGAEGPDWAAISDFIAKNEHLSSQSFIQFGLGSAMEYLAPAGRFAEAKAIIQRIKNMPSLADNEAAQTQLGAMIADMDAKAAEAKAAEKDGSAGGGDGNG